MKKVLILSPHFPPINAPDMQRVRLALPFLREHGWEPTVLAVAPESVEGGISEPLLEATYPADIRVIRVRGVSPRLTRWAGIGSLWWRCGAALARTGARLLQDEKFDAVFFSTTQFNAFNLGPRWKRQFGVPYVLDYQDPWVNEYYQRTQTRPPGGWFKFNLTQRAARRDEPAAVREAGGIVAVSDIYAQQLAARYPWFDPARVTLLPFGATERDFAVAEQHRLASPLVAFDDGRFHQVYAGRCGPDMAFALTVLLRAFRLFQASHPTEASRLRLHFIGTGYAPPPLGRESVMPLARAEGVAESVQEYCYRVPYFDALYYLRRAHALIAVGSDDASYSASKLFPNLLARRPLLLIFHQSSPVHAFAEAAAVGVRFGFARADAGEMNMLAAAVHQRWFVDGGYTRQSPFNETAFAPFSAAILTQKLAAILDQAAASHARAE